MPLFGWISAFQLGWQVGQAILEGVDPFGEPAGGEGDDGSASIDERVLAGMLAQREAFEESEAAKLERSRWLEEHRAERTFPCGVVPDPVMEVDQGGGSPSAPDRPFRPSDPGWAAPPAPVVALPPAEPPPAPLRPMHVLAAVLPDDLAFIREHGGTEEVEEVGRVPRTAIRGVDVVDPRGTHVPDPSREALEPSQVVFTLLRWSNDGVPDEDRFLFRSPWAAWQAGHRLLAARR